MSSNSNTCTIFFCFELEAIIDVFFCRMTAYFNKTGWPANAPTGEQERKDFIASLHKRKTELFMELVEKKLLPLRPGVAKLVTIYLYIHTHYL